MERIGRYEIESELGRGAMGVVYRASDPVIGRTVAIKTIRLGGIDTEAERAKLREGLFREARAAGILSHPHITTIYDMGQAGDMAFIAMEYVPGETLEHVLATEGELSKERIAPVLAETAEALDFAHLKGIIHRDVKPGNIMLHEMGVVKIADFGVAKGVSQDTTHPGIVMGTPSYMSPEQIESRLLDGRSDQFALAVVAYELLTGEKPFSSDTMAGLVFRILRDQPAAPSRLNRTLDERVDAAILKALSKTPGARFPSCAAFVTALTEALFLRPGWQPQARGVSDDLPTLVQGVPAQDEPAVVEPAVAEPAPAIPAPQPVVRPRARRADEPEESGRWKIAAGAVLGVAAVVLAVLRPWQPSSQPEPEPPPIVKSQAPAKPPEPPKPSPLAPAPVTPVPQPKPESPPPANRDPAEPESALVQFTSSPAGAKVTVEGWAESCVTPCSMELGGGRRVIRFSLSGYRPGQAIVEVPGETSVNVNLDAAGGTLIVKTNPPGARILIDGQLRPETTPAMIVLPAGKHRIAVRREGSQDETQDVEIKDRVISNLEINWPQQ